MTSIFEGTKEKSGGIGEKSGGILKRELLVLYSWFLGLYGMVAHACWIKSTVQCARIAWASLSSPPRSRPGENGARRVPPTACPGLFAEAPSPDHVRLRKKERRVASMCRVSDDSKQILK